MQVSVGTKNNEEALEQNHFFVSAFYKGTTIITKHCLELISLKHSEIRSLIGNGYIPIIKA